MKLRVLWVGKSKEEWVKEALADYAGRIRRYCPLELCEVRDEKGAEAEEMRRRECERLEKQIPPGATLVLLDERGRQMASPELAAFIGTQRDAGIGEVIFAVGGAYGFSEEFRSRGRLLSLSKMTFTHQMVRVFLLEQLYRAFSILNNEPYHH
ncbi:23S rRNA (pseudouridine(1915)-N(3))-methyltransferase RlmH [Oryzomonas japonica]|uniref:Ribosomal RNA large subunit methyltransferase H n=1 Tax=Oryzomonas japonica TaxID=2603858 RepID=A0A7J4ZUL9_9BACT|nr:23S rRNA (pseudouridine(1915)-N(3))-methyltransferase RlmH [Oryzomonas japonica]KAB0667232.1 23S rRNA (pseudouridine(1915)-N(3))-methyltransferase RlmH [Oryzomonas japonica]